MDLIYNRRSVRKFDLTKELPDELLKEIIKAGMQAPSARNQQPWHFLVVKNKDILNKLSTVSTGSRILENANCAIILLMEDDSKLVSKEFKIVDMAASIQNIMLEATKHKIGTCWIGVCPNKERMEGVKNIINSQKDVFAMLAIGYPLDENAFHSLNRYDEERINFIK